MRSGAAFDVAIIGAGPAGASLATALGQAGYDVILLHRPGQSAARSISTYETLAGAAQLPLHSLGAWNAFCRLNPIPSVGQMAFWDAGDGAEMPAFFAPYESGWHIERRAFDAMLRSAATGAGALLRPCNGLRQARWTDANGWQLQLRGAADISAAFVVDASGRSRVFARRMGAISERNDDLMALIGHVRMCGHGSSGKLLVEAAKIGWWYAVPAADGCGTVALMTDPATAATFGLGHSNAWQNALALTSRLSRMIDLSTSPTEPLRKLAGASRAVPSGGANWLALGDAAQAFDPLAGKGVTQALWDGLRGAEAISRWLAGARKPLHLHRQMQTDSYRRHLQQKSAYYRLERRWQEVPFWRNRAERLPVTQDAVFA